MSFAYTLRKFREQRGLTLRELGKLCGVDHAYIHRLEKGEKTSPSKDVMDTLIRALSLDNRRAHIFRFLVGKHVSHNLIDVFIEDEDRPLEIFDSLAQMSFRDKRPETKEDWRKWADRLQQLMLD